MVAPESARIAVFSGTPARAATSLIVIMFPFSRGTGSEAFQMPKRRLFSHTGSLCCNIPHGIPLCNRALHNPAVRACPLFRNNGRFPCRGAEWMPHLSVIGEMNSAGGLSAETGPETSAGKKCQKESWPDSEFSCCGDFIPALFSPFSPVRGRSSCRSGSMPATPFRGSCGRS